MKNAYLHCTDSVSTIDRNPFDGYNFIAPGCQLSQGQFAIIFDDMTTMICFSLSSRFCCYV